MKPARPHHRPLGLPLLHATDERFAPQPKRTDELEPVIDDGHIAEKRLGGAA